jgi:hypothetical protein
VAEIQYSLRFEHSFWADVDLIQPDRGAWGDMFDAIYDVLERTPEIHPVRIPETGGRILPTRRHVSPRQMVPMYVLYAILRPAPDGLVSLRRVATEEDVRGGLVRLTDEPSYPLD